MKKIKYLAICLMTLILSACNVHEWPEIPDKVSFNLKLSYETNEKETRMDFTKEDYLKIIKKQKRKYKKNSKKYCEKILEIIN